MPVSEIDAWSSIVLSFPCMAVLVVEWGGKDKDERLERLLSRSAAVRILTHPNTCSCFLIEVVGRSVYWVRIVQLLIMILYHQPFMSYMEPFL